MKNQNTQPQSQQPIEYGEPVLPDMQNLYAAQQQTAKLPSWEIGTRGTGESNQVFQTPGGAQRSAEEILALHGPEPGHVDQHD